MYLVVGLGNPGMKYKSTYHNLGFMTVDAVAKKIGVKFVADKRVFAHVAKGIIDGEPVVLAKPDTFMNASGNAVKELVRRYDVDVKKELIVVYDDADLPLGKTRLREDGSAGSHNGMRNIVGALEQTDFKRIRIGIKNNDLAENDVKLIDLVLSKLSYDDKCILTASINEVAESVVELVGGVDVQRVEQRLNKK